MRSLPTCRSTWPTRVAREPSTAPDQQAARSSLAKTKAPTWPRRPAAGPCSTIPAARTRIRMLPGPCPTTCLVSRALDRLPATGQPRTLSCTRPSLPLPPPGHLRSLAVRNRHQRRLTRRWRAAGRASKQTACAQALGHQQSLIGGLIGHKASRLPAPGYRRLQRNCGGWRAGTTEGRSQRPASQCPWLRGRHNNGGQQEISQAHQRPEVQRLPAVLGKRQLQGRPMRSLRWQAGRSRRLVQFLDQEGLSCPPGAWHSASGVVYGRSAFGRSVICKTYGQAPSSATETPCWFRAPSAAQPP